MSKINALSVSLVLATLTAPALAADLSPRERALAAYLGDDAVQAMRAEAEADNLHAGPEQMATLMQDDFCPFAPPCYDVYEILVAQTYAHLADGLDVNVVALVTENAVTLLSQEAIAAAEANVESVDVQASGPFESRATAAFDAAPAVQAATSELTANGLTAGDVEQVEIGGGCGFAGCEKQYVLVRHFTHGGYDARATVKAIVRVSTYGQATVSVFEALVP
jgi:hypothetical protein